MRHFFNPAAISAAFGCVLLSASSAFADETFAFKVHAADLDFAAVDSGPTFQTLIETVAQDSFVYIDWHLKSAWKSEVFNVLDAAVAETAGPDADLDQDVCDKVETMLAAGPVEFGGRPDPENNHLLISLTMRVSPEDPFAIARCEYSVSSYSLRIRGFFYVTDEGIAAADQYEFRPVTIAADRVPAAFFKRNE